MKYKKKISLKYQYVDSEESKLSLEETFDNLIFKIYRDLKTIEEAKKEYCSLLSFTAKDYPEFLIIQTLDI